MPEDFIRSIVIALSGAKKLPVDNQFNEPHNQANDESRGIECEAGNRTKTVKDKKCDIYYQNDKEIENAKRFL